MTKPWLIASTKGGHCFTVRTSASCTAEKASAGMARSQPGNALRAGDRALQPVEQGGIAAEDDAHRRAYPARILATAARRNGISSVMMLRLLNSAGLAKVRYSLRAGSSPACGNQGSSR